MLLTVLLQIAEKMERHAGKLVRCTVQLLGVTLMVWFVLTAKLFRLRRVT
jgi:hypothetical protein